MKRKLKARPHKEVYSKLKERINIIIVSGAAAFLANASSQYMLTGKGQIDYFQALITTVVFIVLFFFFTEAKKRGKI